jgi:hypothetical protein
MCTVLLPPGVNPIAVKYIYIISYHMCRIDVELADIFTVPQYLVNGMILELYCLINSSIMFFFLNLREIFSVGQKTLPS